LPTITQTFDDEFDYFQTWDGLAGWDPFGGPQWANAGRLLDPSGTEPFNNELEWYVNPTYVPPEGQQPLPDPFSVSNGVLSITAAPTNPPIANYYDAFNVSSGIITSNQSLSQLYGYFEMRAQIPAGDGLFPAFWLLPADGSHGEIDIMEILGKDPTTLYTTAHSFATGQDVESAGITKIPDASQGFHTYGVDWEPDYITWYFDGQEVFQAATPSDLNKPMYMIANLAVGDAGSFPGPPDASTPFPASFKIDYIRAYSARPSGDVSFLASSGNHTYDGTGTSDTLSYQNATGSVTLDIANGTTAVGGNGFGGTDTFTGIDNFEGSSHDDTFMIGGGNHTIVGSGGTDTVVFSGPASDYAIATNGSDVSVSGDGYVDTLTGITFAKFADGTSQTLPGETAPCYCRGTLILTDRGEKAVQDLAIGDRVISMHGAARPIRWIGRRAYSGRFACGRKHILPICIAAGAIEDNVPRRDLWISPHHAMYLDGMLIEARNLINGISIIQPERVDAVEYFHLELDTHAVLIAEGALSESFVDDDSRGMFHNAHEYFALYPNASNQPAQFCAPRHHDGYVLEGARRRLNVRAGRYSNPVSTGMALRGSLEVVTAHRIEGWAQNPEHPEAPVCVDILCNGRLFGQALANRYRGDLKRSGLGSGCHGFSFTPPKELAFAPDAVTVRRSLDGAAIAPASHLAASALRRGSCE
jgi:beta-glucanase (GH16 family)